LDDTDDVALLNYLNEAALLGCLRRRYLQDKIYTNVNRILISVNPFRAIAGLYDLPLGWAECQEFLDGRRPHVYATAGRAFSRLVEGWACQSIVVSGESGAGKTEACKKVRHRRGIRLTHTKIDALWQGRLWGGRLAITDQKKLPVGYSFCASILCLVDVAHCWHQGPMP
jgi:hypothetical protein